MAGNWHRIGDIKGADGVGVPTGGARGDVLKKEGGTDYATSWGAVDYADIQGKVPASALPEIGTAPHVVDSQAAMLNLDVVPGRQAIRTDIGATFVLAQEPASTLENWIEMVSRSDVTSVNDKTGSVVLTKADVGLSEVNNTADSDKPVATQSVRGLMSSDDKTKLDGATHSATSNALARRDSAGRIAFSSVSLSDQPSQSGHAVPLGFLETALEGKYGTGRELTATDNLDDLKDADESYTQSQNVEASLELGYPVESAGALFVKSGPQDYHAYHVYISYGTSSTAMYWRSRTTAGWGDWKQVAEHELATSSRDGLMSRDDKALLDAATRSNTSDSLVKRGSGYNPTHIGRAETDNITYIGQNASGPQAVANKQYVDWEIGRLVASGTIGFDQSWNTLGSLSRAGIVEGFPLGSPAGVESSINAADASSGFVKDPVWRFHHEVMGLGYHRQTAELLSCDPTYMIGFTWERTYHPGTSTWARWTCIAGDTGDIAAMSSSASVSGTRNREWTFTYQNDALYTEGELPLMRRVGSAVYLSGAASPRSGSDVSNLDSNDGMQVGYFRYDDEWPIRRVWVDDSHVTLGATPKGVGVQQGSSRERWYLNIVDNENKQLSIRAARYGPGSPSTSTWLPYSTSWTAPQVLTWQGSGWSGG